MRASLVAQMVMNLPAMQETQVQSLRWEYPLEKVIATHSSILAWRTPWTATISQFKKKKKSGALLSSKPVRAC